MSDSSLSAALERMKEDKMSTLSKQLQWMRKAKFTEVDCGIKITALLFIPGANDAKKI